MESSLKTTHPQYERGETSEQPGACPDPSVPLAQGVAEIWAEFLDGREVGADDSFFEIGGNSLVGIRILDRLSQTYGVQLSVRDFYLAQTPARIAELIERGRDRT
ncbi:acyl carrier protein [Streptomyces sp. NPDC096013]|uniref:acyl carrier protein n=1 Tax=Streptomyces sp. NPDC096013 TaxID=3366069 RepID=UPI00382D507F